MLNVLVVMDRADLDETVTVSAKAGRTPGIGLIKGERFTVRKLLEMTLIASANDAAEALATHIGGTEAHFVKLMNAKAKKLGLKHTHAIDPHGLSKREHSTAHDLSVLATHVMAIPVLRKIIGMHSVTVTIPGRGSKKHRTTDKLLGHYKGLFGVKTGFTNPAGYCFVGMAKRGKVSLTSVVLGGRTPSSRFSQTRKLLDWGFSGFKTKRLVSAETTMGVVQVLRGVRSSVSVHPSRSVTTAVWMRSHRTRKLILPASVSAPIHRGDQLGVVRISQDGTTLASVALLADADVATAAAPAAAAFVEPQGATSAVPSSILGRLWAAIMAGLRLGSAASGSAL